MKGERKGRRGKREGKEEGKEKGGRKRGEKRGERKGQVAFGSSLHLGFRSRGEKKNCFFDIRVRNEGEKKTPLMLTFTLLSLFFL